MIALFLFDLVVSIIESITVVAIVGPEQSRLCVVLFFVTTINKHKMNTALENKAPSINVVDHGVDASIQRSIPGHFSQCLDSLSPEYTDKRVQRSCNWTDLARTQDRLSCPGQSTQRA